MGVGTHNRCHLYESDQVLLQTAMPGALLTGQNVVRRHRVTWDPPVTLQANTTYRLTIRPTTTTGVRYFWSDAPSNEAMEQLPGGRLWHGTMRTFGGAWTDEPERRYTGSNPGWGSGRQAAPCDE